MGEVDRLFGHVPFGAGSFSCMFNSWDVADVVIRLEWNDILRAFP